MSLRKVLGIVLLPIVVPYAIVRVLAMIVVSVVGMILEWILTLGRRRRYGDTESFPDRYPRIEGFLSHSLAVLVVGLALARVGAEVAVHVACRYARTGDASTRLIATKSLRLWLSGDLPLGHRRDAFDVLVDVAATDEAEHIRRVATKVLAEECGEHPSPILALGGYLNGGSETRRHNAIDAVALLATRENGALSDLALCLTDRVPGLPPSDLARRLAERLPESVIYRMLVGGSTSAFEAGLCLIEAGDGEAPIAAVLRASTRLTRTPIKGAGNRLARLARSLERSNAPGAGDAFEQIRWLMAKSQGTSHAYRRHLADFPGGRNTEKAETIAAALEADDRPFHAALAAGTPEALEQFLLEYPGHARAAEATQLSRDLRGRDLISLVDEGRVEVEVLGAGIKSTRVRLRRLVPERTPVRISRGTYFVSHRPGAQNMVATSDTYVSLWNDAWITESVPSACANRAKDIPSESVRFSVRRTSDSEELTRLIPVLDAASVPFSVRQAAVWIVTDDATYSQLGQLVETPSFGAGTGSRRVIEEEDAARALHICDQAGIEIEGKRLWKDREAIRRSLPEGDIKAWLTSRSAE